MDKPALQERIVRMLSQIEIYTRAIYDTAGDYKEVLPEFVKQLKKPKAECILRLVRA
jgi:hypothetical protein